jgi:hypothetical protein
MSGIEQRYQQLKYLTVPLCGCFMPRRDPRPIPLDDLSFPVPFREQGKYLKLASDFLSPDDNQPPHTETPIERDRPVQGRKVKNVA